MYYVPLDGYMESGLNETSQSEVTKTTSSRKHGQGAPSVSVSTDREC